MQISFTFANGTTFRWGKNKSEITNPSKKQPARPAQIDYREYPVANAELTQGLYHNSFPGLKLAGSMAYKPIATPVEFMGIPTPITEDKEAQKFINTMVEEFFTKMSNIHTQSHREGTIWIWPKYDSKKMQLLWEFIPDESVTDVIVDIHTREIIEIITDEQIMIVTDYNEIVTVRRRREFTRKKITVTWDGPVPDGTDSEAYRNPIGILPIPFANNKDGEGHRGYSDYERILADMKDYHDIDYMQSSMLAKFKIKMVQHFGSSVDEWLEYNGMDDISDINVATIDFIMNQANEEETSFIFPENAYQAYEAVLKRKFKKIVEGSGMPEILWGIATDGNHASAADDMQTFVMYVNGKQTQHNKSYLDLFTASLRLYELAGKISSVPEIKITWNTLNAVGEKVRAEIFALFAKGIADLINVAGITKEQVFKLWKCLYPDATGGDLEAFKLALSDMAQHNQFRNAGYLDALDAQGEPVE